MSRNSRPTPTCGFTTRAMASIFTFWPSCVSVARTRAPASRFRFKGGITEVAEERVRSRIAEGIVSKNRAKHAGFSRGDSRSAKEGHGLWLRAKDNNNRANNSRMLSTGHLVERPCQFPAPEGSAGSVLDMALYRPGWLHTPQVSAELLEAWTAAQESTDQVF